MTPDVRYAAIDCGTNSTRLLIGDGRSAFEREMRITGLGRGVDATGLLSADGIERVRIALEEFRGIMDRYELAGVRMTATSAMTRTGSTMFLTGTTNRTSSSPHTLTVNIRPVSMTAT